MTKKTMTAKNAAAAKRAMKAPRNSAAQAAQTENTIEAIRTIARTSTKKPTKSATATPSDGGKPEAIRAAAKKAAVAADAPAGAVVKISRSRKKAVEQFKKAVATAPEATLPVSAQLALSEKLIKAQFLSNEYLARLNPAKRHQHIHLSLWLEQFYQVIERDIKVPPLDQINFNNWIDTDLRAHLADGEYARLTFEDGRRGIALGTYLYPAVCYQTLDSFAAQLQQTNPVVFKDLEKFGKAEPKIVTTVRIPTFLLSLMGREEGQPLTIGELHETFGSPMCHITPDGQQYNLALKMRQCRECLNAIPAPAEIKDEQKEAA